MTARGNTGLSAVDPEGARKVMTGEFRIFVGSGQPETGATVSSGAFYVERGSDLPR